MEGSSQTQKLSFTQLEEMSEAELESLILDKQNSNNDARYILGKLMIEGSSEKVPQNETKGLNWVKEAIKKGSIQALECKTYWDIRFNKEPKLDKITDSLEKIANSIGSTRAFNTLAELAHSQAGAALKSENQQDKEVGAQKAVLAAKYYQTSAEKGDIIGCHWMGVFYDEGFGVNKNLEKAVGYLKKSGEAGNGHSMFQLYLIHSGNQGQDDAYKNVELAYQYLVRAIQLGVTVYEEAIAYFKKNYDILAPFFVKSKKLNLEVKQENQNDILNMYTAWMNELKNDFSAALGKDRLYHKPSGFLNDQQSWMIGVQIQYFLDSVLRFSHKDFIKAIKLDLGPVLGYTGLWALKNLSQQAKDAENADLKKKIQVVSEIIEKYMENELEVLGDEKKYNFINKFGPKKCPDNQILRSSITHLYSWQHFAPLSWFEHIKKQALDIKNRKEGKVDDQKYCNSCQSAEGTALKHKICSACKSVYYCSVECQKQDWKNGHKERCKDYQKNLSKKK